MTFFAVLIGVSFVAGTFMLSDTITRTFTDLFGDIYKNTDAVVRGQTSFEASFGAGSQRPRIPEEIVEQAREINGVAAAEGSLQIDYAQMIDKKGKAIGDPAQGAPVLGFNWSDDRELSPWRLQSGAPPETNDEVVIDASSAKDAKFKSRDKIRIITQQGLRTYTISGVAKFGDANNIAGASIALFTLPEAQRIANAEGKIDSVSVRSDSGIPQQDIVRRLRSGLPEKNLDILTGEQISDETSNEINDAISVVTIFIQGFAGVALIVGMFVIYNTFSIVVAQRTRELALVRALGGSRRQIRRVVVLEALAVGAVASAVGIVGGIGISSLLLWAFAQFGADLPTSGTIILPRAIIVPIIAGVVVTTLSAIIPARRAARVPPVAAMRDVAFEKEIRVVPRVVGAFALFVLGASSVLYGVYGGINNGIGLAIIGAVCVLAGVVVLGPLIARPIGGTIGRPIKRFRGVPGLMARENALRNPRRTAGTAYSVVVCVMLVGAILVIAASARRSIDIAVDRAIRADLVVFTGGFGGNVGLSPEAVTTIDELSDVQAATGLRWGPARLDDSSQFVTGIDPNVINKLADLDVSAGNLDGLNTPGTIAINKTEARARDLKVGSMVDARFPQTTGTSQLRVVAIFDEQALTSYWVISIAEYEKFFREQLDAQVLVRLREGVDVEAGKEQVETALKEFPTVQVLDQAGYKKLITDQINQFVAMLYVLLALAVIVSVLGIINTLGLSIYERYRELGLIRAVGMTRRQVRSTIRWEAVIVSLLGTLLGLVLGILLGWILVKGVESQGITSFAVSPVPLAVVVVIAALVGMFAAVLPAFRAARIDILKAISYE